jgi:alkylation response protein AidB-like acyl-CoA dehydrogenase
MGCAITEPDAGSDSAATTTEAMRQGDEYAINGSKMFITNAKRGNCVLVFVCTDPKNPNRHKRHSFIIVETDKPGYEANKLTGKLGVRASETCEVTFSNVTVPASNLIGTENNDGFKQLMSLFNTTRVYVVAQAIGIARGALEEAIRYAKQRHTFGLPLSSHQAIQFMIAEMYTKIQASRSMLYEAVWKVDHGIIDPALIASAKWFSSRTAIECADAALQIHGGYGYFADYKVQRLYRDAKAVDIYEGTTQIEKIIIARRILQ